MEGNDGNLVFQTEITLLNRRIGVGTGYSKKESHQNAAKMAIKKLRTDKEIQQYISNLKKKQQNRMEDNGFEELPEEITPRIKNKGETRKK